ncbi:CHAT domain-containing protein [Suillus bovinus]|uniref:CHAT domain-containing protein n=1 Tax=Suillus bovinus TaxID=48563 RepID=UPI001B87DB63|nr:CHAT domain-containing protein [Suillus bovinus]KAG2153595.1 CHAT domain-containing protein [Suillus bovinus]
MLQTRFKRRGKDMDQAITLQTEVLSLHPVGHTDRSKSLNNFANQLSSRFEHRGNEEDLDEAIALHREALALRPVGHRSVHIINIEAMTKTWMRLSHFTGKRWPCAPSVTDRSISLSNLAIELSSRSSIEAMTKTWMRLSHFTGKRWPCAPSVTDRSISLNLAIELSSRFEHRGNDEDLDEAIALHREALALRPVGPQIDSSLNINLAIELSSRFQHRGNDDDLDQAIALHREALALRPSHRGNEEDLDQPIALHREALALRPVGHPDRSISLSNLATELSSHFQHRGNEEDLDEVIALHREALASRPLTHADRSMSLNNLAIELSSRFEHRGNEEDLDQAIALHREALALRPLSRADRSMITYNLAGDDRDSLNAAMHHFKAAANVFSGGLLSRLRTSLLWVDHASQHLHATELEAYATSMQLLDSYMSTTALVSSRHNIMRCIPNTLAVDAASCALRSGDVCRAVELLEQGRTIIWTQMTRLRTPLDGLQTHGDHAVALMKRFRDISSLLDKSPANNLEGNTRVNVEAEETRYRRLVQDWNRAAEEIRKIEGFSRFLLSPLFSDLQDAACDGSIIVLIASESSCHAIIVTHKQPPTSIQLPTNLPKLVKLVPAFQEAIKKEAGHKGNQTALIKALRELWDDVVGPVVESLSRIARRGSRIWWCPTSLFNFLPLHAAGECRARGKSLSQQYISSYTPSLTALIKARASHDKSSSVPFVAIGQDCPADALFTLDAVEPELELVRRLLPPSPTVSFSKITSADATKLRVLCALRDNAWFHLACHGTQRIDEPFKSAFLLRDQPLSLLDITQTDLSLHEFAFLSACETAVGVSSTPDEVIHLAAGLQFSGVNSVVGTLWKTSA